MYLTKVKEEIFAQHGEKQTLEKLSANPLFTFRVAT
jgi:hypothetical protein